MKKQYGRLQLWLLKMIPGEGFVELREAFQALSRSKQDIFLWPSWKPADV